MSLVSENAELAAAVAAATLERIDDARGFDAIVVGAGAAGGLAAQQLTHAGLSTLVLDAGWEAGFFESPVRNTISSVVRTVADPRLYDALPPRFIDIGRRALRMAGRIHQPVQARCFAWELAPQCFVDDRENPYIAEPGTQFNWFRAHQIGGRMVIPGHGQQYYRLSRADFSPGDDLTPKWGFAPEELDPWYDLVESKLGLSGGAEHLTAIPDSRLSKVLKPSLAEQQVIDLVSARWPHAQPMLGRSAVPLPTLVSAAKSGQLFCRTGAIVSDVEVDDSQHVSAVRWYDRALGHMHSVRARLVFLCASTLATTRVLLSSRSPTCPGGIGAASGALGRYLMDHVLLSANGTAGALPGEPVANQPGRCVYLPRVEVNRPGASGRRSFGVQIYRWTAEPGRSHFTAVSFSEMTPRAENYVKLDPHRRDAWGLPVLRINCTHSQQELATAGDQNTALREICETLGVTAHRLDVRPSTPGTAIHECGTARMGDSPANSVLDRNNECWDARGLYVTDAAAFPSQGLQNPTLTILALTARACDHAVRLHQCNGQRAA